MMNAYPIIGMSPGNSYFKDEEVRYLLQTVLARYGECAILVADIPAIATYKALGYPDTKARNKAVLKGNNLKNRVRKIQQELNIQDEKVHIIDWATEVAENAEYQDQYNKTHQFYLENATFQTSVRETSEQVLYNANRNIADTTTSLDTAVHYLLSEIAFLEWAPTYLQKDQVVYVYHKNWPVYEKYVAGVFDGVKRAHLEFLLLENPYETYTPLAQAASAAGILRASFSHYPPAFIKNEDTLSGIFHDILERYAASIGSTVKWTEEIGYGVIIEGLTQHRFDIFGSTVWPTPERMKEAAFTQSLYSSPVYLWVREGVEPSLDTVRSNEFTIAIREQDVTDSITTADYPNARIVRIPQLGTMNDLLHMVSSGVADGTFAEPYVVEQYNNTTDAPLVAHSTIGKVREYENTFMLGKDNIELLTNLNHCIQQLQDDGVIEALLRTYTGSEHLSSPSSKLSTSRSR